MYPPRHFLTCAGLCRQELADQQARAELASKLFQGISNLTSTLAQRYSQAASEKANATATLGQTAQKSQPGDAIADMPDAIAEERKAIAQVGEGVNDLSSAQGGVSEKGQQFNPKGSSCIDVTVADS